MKIFLLFILFHLMNVLEAGTFLSNGTYCNASLYTYYGAIIQEGNCTSDFTTTQQGEYYCSDPSCQGSWLLSDDDDWVCCSCSDPTCDGKTVASYDCPGGQLVTYSSGSIFVCNSPSCTGVMVDSSILPQYDQDGWRCFDPTCTGELEFLNNSWSCIDTTCPDGMNFMNGRWRCTNLTGCISQNIYYNTSIGFWECEVQQISPSSQSPQTALVTPLGIAIGWIVGFIVGGFIGWVYKGAKNKREKKINSEPLRVAL